MTSLAVLDEFRSKTLSHPHLLDARKRLRSAIRQADPGSMIFMFGPTGVGKSTLASHLREKLDKEIREVDGDDESTIPATIMEAPYPDIQRFSWKEFYRRALVALHEPLIHKKAYDPRRSPLRWQARTDSRAPGHELRLAFENALHYRKVRVLLIDEAQHIAKGTTASGLHDQLDYIKSMANLTGTVIVLVGTYELLAFRNLSAQLSRRSVDVHFPRYRADEPAEYQIFGNVVATFADRVPIPCSFEMTDMLEDLYAGSLGCVGILSGWMMKAMKRAMDEGDGTLRRRDIEASMYSHSQLLKMFQELQEGEMLLTPPRNAMADLKARLSLSSPTPSQPARSAAGKKAKVGRRKPVRDPVVTST